MLRTCATSKAVRPMSTSKRAWDTATASVYGFTQSLNRLSP